MIVIIDYGAGNLFSVQNALNFLGFENKISSDKKEIENADKLILPGVGAFPDAMKKLNTSGLIDTVKEQAKKKSFLGICLGMQMLFEKGYEFGETDGLGLIGGSVELMKPENGLVIPQMGWNALEINNDCPMLAGIKDGSYFYFVHSFAAKCADMDVAAYTNYGGRVTAMVHSGTVYGCQFHPEKSGETGLKMLKNFATLKD